MKIIKQNIKLIIYLGPRRYYNGRLVGPSVFNIIFSKISLDQDEKRQTQNYLLLSRAILFS